MGPRLRHALLTAAILVALVSPPRAGSPHPRRIVTLAPSLTESVFALGAGEHVVGVGDYARWPAEVAGLPRLGGLVNPNVERLLGLRPDLVLIPSPMPRLQEACAGAGIPVVRVPMETLEDVRGGLLRLGELLGRPGRARELVAGLDRGLSRLRRATAGLPRPTVLLVVDRPETGALQHVVAAGPGTFLDQLLETAGGRNAFSDAVQRYFTPSPETILRKRPGIILELHAGAPDPSTLEIRARKVWSRLFGPAGTPEVRVVTSQAVVVPGPRLVEGAAELTRAIHPGLELPP